MGVASQGSWMQAIVSGVAGFAAGYLLSVYGREFANKKLSKPINKEGTWITEESDFETSGYAQSYKVLKQLHSEQTPYQKIEIWQTSSFGNLMILDGVFQNTESDEFSYHEMISHVPLFSHPNPKRVLIIGGGDGGVAREVLKHDCVEQVDMVEIDKRVTDLARKYFKGIAAALNHPKLTVIHEDGAKFVSNPELTGFYDVIIVDSSDPIGPNQVLFREPFYRNVHRCLAANGLAVTQGECMWLHPKTIHAVMSMAEDIFALVNHYWISIPVYPCGTIGFTALSKGSYSLDKVHPDRFKAAEEMSRKDMSYYNTSIHTASFAKPTFFYSNTSILKPARNS